MLSVVVCPPLPLDMLSFNGYPEENRNQLLWTTVNEKNMDWHVVERSPDGVNNFAEIGRQHAQNTSTAEYEMTDNLPLPLGYYRVRSVDVNGNTDFSSVIEIMRTENLASLQIYPNPTKDWLEVTFVSPEQTPVKIALTDAQGKILMEQVVTPTASRTQFRLSTERLADGVYFLILNDGVSRQVRKVVKE